MSKILVVDDEKPIRDSLKEILEYENHQVTEAADGKKALEIISKESFDVVFCDIKMPGLDGIEVLEKILEISPDTSVIMISGHGTIDTAVEAIKKGAFDFISKPLDLNRLMITIRNATDKTILVKETKVLKKRINKAFDMIGDSKPIEEIKELIEKVAPTDARVLITGPNGSGKELVARWTHLKSNRAEHPLIEVNCAAIPSELIESELFGHEKGAFTSAISQRKGKFELANEGTLFLDEIGDMSLSAQAKVLRALQESKITRVGGDKEIKVNVRVLAATNKNLSEEIKKGNFREDLYHRLSVIIIKVPALNERRDDIPMLVKHFISNICNDYGIAEKEIDDAALEEMKKYNWTGNIRELRNVVERLIILSAKKIEKSDVLKFAPANN
jgi:two-component system, NtrC family, nitrogen regulation response regulator NtrX